MERVLSCTKKSKMVAKGTIELRENTRINIHHSNPTIHNPQLITHFPQILNTLLNLSYNSDGMVPPHNPTLLNSKGPVEVDNCWVGMGISKDCIIEISDRDGGLSKNRARLALAARPSCKGN
jgi:hypothetical protein